MGVSKTESFTESQNRIAILADALSHPARIAILDFLKAQSACVCGDIVSELPLSQSTVSQHLKVLKQSGLIKGVISGANTCYCIDNEVWDTAQKVFSEFLQPIVIKECC
jgi:predicted transcriptional regulator